MMEHPDNGMDPIARIETTPEVLTLFHELKSGLSMYYKIAEDILHQCGVQLKPRQKNEFTLDKHFFSFLFMYSYYRADIPEPRRIFYAATLQCLRGMVTGCDNLLDDEYKKTLDTDLPEDSYRIRSVIDIMISDRVLFQLLVDACRQHEFDEGKVMAAMTASMKTMTSSAVQEASEESGIQDILTPEDLLGRVHHYKTGLLFTCPWDIPRVIEKSSETEITSLMEALYHIGMGCQIMDDMVDFADDIRKKRHNYLSSLIFHGTSSIEKDRLMEMIHSRNQKFEEKGIKKDFSASILKAADVSGQFLEKGLTQLLLPKHQPMVKPCIQFLADRIGVIRYVDI